MGGGDLFSPPISKTKELTNRKTVRFDKAPPLFQLAISKTSPPYNLGDCEVISGGVDPVELGLCYVCACASLYERVHVCVCV